MIINLWSTPRTGSVWYSFHLAKLHPGSLRLNEMFNPRHMNMYHLHDTVSDSFLNHHRFVDGSFYHDYYLDDQGFIQKRRIYAERSRSPAEETEYLKTLIHNRNPQQVLILHNHIEPIDTGVRQYLLHEAKENIWIHRRNKTQQLASYAVAMITGRFVSFGLNPCQLPLDRDCNPMALINLMQRIRVWDSHVKSQVVAFEDIDFYHAPDFPRDQNHDPWTRCSAQTQSLIKQLVDDYENSQIR